MPNRKLSRHTHATEFTVEKSRQQSFIQRYAYPLRDAAPSALEYFWEHKYLYSRTENLEWRDLGPANYAGRATCIAVDPNNPEVLFAGSAAGGLWKSENSGKDWTPCWPFGLNQNIGAIAFHPSDSRMLICATGEGNFAGAGYPGSGIYATEDGGFTWNTFITAPSGARLEATVRQTIPRRVASISYSAPGSLGQRRIAFGTVSNDPSLRGGLYLDGGESGLSFVSRWGNRPYNCYSAVFHPTDSDVLYAAIEAGGSVNGIWRSGDTGQTWKQLTAGMPAGELLGRISLAISPSHPDILYALASSRGRRVIGVFRSDDGGQSWVDTAGTTFVKEGQLAYNNAIAVHPEDPDIVICGAQNLFRTTNGGVAWAQISQNDPTDTKIAYVHSDQHAILMSGGNLSAGMLVYSANDGGIAISRDLGTTWDSSSRGMATIQFYEADVSPANGDVFGGGTQDNGTLLAGVTNGVGLQTGRKNRRDFVRVLAGDGGYVVFDPGNVERVYASSLGADMSMHAPGRRWADGQLPTAWEKITPEEISKAEKGQRALTVLAIEPGANRRGRKLFLGTYRLWMWTLIDLRWQPASQFGFDGSSISAIEVSPVDTKLMFVGTSNGGVFRSRDGGVNWSADLSGPEIPSVVITDIRTHPRDSNVVAVAVASTGAQAAVLEGHDSPFSHVFRSSDYGKTWDDIDGGKLPNVVFTSLEYETHGPYRLMAAGDAGPWIFESASRWISLAGDIPNVVISDIVYHHKDRTLTAATYGRGMWRTRLPRKLKIEPPDKKVLPEKHLPPVEGYTPSSRLASPQPTAPLPNQHFDDSPRETKFAWDPVDGAVGYVVELTSDSEIRRSQASREPFVTIQIFGIGTRHWRVWALYPEGRCSLPSDLRSFHYTRGREFQRNTRP